MSENREQFAKRLDYYLKLNNLTQMEVANAIGSTRSSISSWVIGTRIPRLDALNKLVSYLNISVNDLMGNELLIEHMTVLDNQLSEKETEVLNIYNTRIDTQRLIDSIIKLDKKDIAFINYVIKNSINR